MINNMKWNDLPLSQRAKYIKLGVSNGLTSLREIIDVYNQYSEGGFVHKYDGTSEDTQQMNKRTYTVRDRNTGKEVEFNTRQEADDYISTNYNDPSFYQGELSELNVIGRKPRSVIEHIEQGAKNFEETFGVSPKTAAGFIPVVGDAIDLADIGTDLYEGNYINAGIGAGLFLVPNIIEKPAKALYRGVRKAIKSARDYKIGRELSKVPLSRSRTKAPVSTTISYTPSNKPAERARLDFLERGPTNISEAERVGIPRGERNNIDNSTTYGNVSPEDIPTGFPSESPNVGPASYQFSEDLLRSSKSDYTTNLKEYIGSLPDTETTIDRLTIGDYRRYLNNNGIRSDELSDVEISKLLQQQYDDLVAQQSGKLKGSIMYHGSPVMFDRFDFSHTGDYTGNIGAVGPGNYFSTGRNRYGLKDIWSNIGTRTQGNMQPYLITDIESTPISSILAEKGLLPEYQSSASKEYIQELIDNRKLGNNIFIIDEHSVSVPNTTVPLRDGMPVTPFEGMVARNTGIKSLFPHPSLLQKNNEGIWQMIRDWNDPRVNYSQGGVLNKFDDGGPKPRRHSRGGGGSKLENSCKS